RELRGAAWAGPRPWGRARRTRCPTGRPGAHGESGSAAAPRGERGETAGAALRARGRVAGGGPALATSRAAPALAGATASPGPGAGADLLATARLAVLAAPATALAALTLAAATAAALAAAALSGRTAPAAPAATAAAPAFQARLVDGRLGLARLEGLDALAGRELGEAGAEREDRVPRDGRVSGLAHQLAHVALLLGRLHGDDGAGLAGAGGAARTVQVRLVLHGRIGVDHQGHLVHVDAAGGDVGAHHRRRGAGAEGLEVPGAGVLGEVAVQVHRVHAAGGELAGQVLRSVLGAGEHDRAARRGGQVAQHVEAGGGGDLVHVVLHGPHGARGRSGGVGDRLVQELLDQLVHPGVESRGE